MLFESAPAIKVVPLYSLCRWNTISKKSLKGHYLEPTVARTTPKRLLWRNSLGSGKRRSIRVSSRAPMRKTEICVSEVYGFKCMK